MTDPAVPFFKHDLGEPELREIAKVFSGTILTTGEVVAEFERRFADISDGGTRSL